MLLAHLKSFKNVLRKIILFVYAFVRCEATHAPNPRRQNNFSRDFRARFSRCREVDVSLRDAKVYRRERIDLELMAGD